MGLLPDDEASRIRRFAEEDPKRTTPDVWRSWVRQLLEDRRARTALLQKIARRIHWTRRRHTQAVRYIDGLLDTLERDTREPWPRQIPCPICGAAASSVRAEHDGPATGTSRPSYVLVHDHPDGATCEPADDSADETTASRVLTHRRETRAVRNSPQRSK